MAMVPSNGIRPVNSCSRVWSRGGLSGRLIPSPLRRGFEGLSNRLTSPDRPNSTGGLAPSAASPSPDSVAIRLDPLVWRWGWPTPPVPPLRSTGGRSCRAGWICPLSNPGCWWWTSPLVFCPSEWIGCCLNRVAVADRVSATHWWWASPLALPLPPMLTRPRCCCGASFPSVPCEPYVLRDCTLRSLPARRVSATHHNLCLICGAPTLCAPNTASPVV